MGFVLEDVESGPEFVGHNMSQLQKNMFDVIFPDQTIWVCLGSQNILGNSGPRLAEEPPGRQKGQVRQMMNGPFIGRTRCNQPQKYCTTVQHGLVSYTALSTLFLDS